MEPRSQRIANPEVAGLLDQDQECGLKCVLGIMWVDELCSADAQNHRAVALDQRLESQFRDFEAAGRKPLQQLPVRKVSDCPDVEERAQLPSDGSILPGLHRSDPPRLFASRRCE